MIDPKFILGIKSGFVKKVVIVLIPEKTDATNKIIISNDLNNTYNVYLL